MTFLETLILRKFSVKSIIYDVTGTFIAIYMVEFVSLLYIWEICETTIDYYLLRYDMIRNSKNYEKK